MDMQSKYLSIKKLWKSHRARRNQRSIERIAFYLHQQRIRFDRKGNEVSDWKEAKKIIQSPVKRLLYTLYRALEAITAPGKWVASGILDRTSWEWLELLIIPLFLAGGAFYLEKQDEQRQERIATKRYEQEFHIADERAKQEVLAEYIKQMKELLLDKGLRESTTDSEVRTVARAITATTIRGLDGKRNALLIRFLQESSLIQRAEESENESVDRPLPLLARLDLSGADLSGTNLYNADFRGADLTEANLSQTNLNSASFGTAILRRADFSDAWLVGANFDTPDPAFKFIKADLYKTNFSRANLHGAVVQKSALRESILCETKLPEGFTTESSRDCQK